MKTWLKIVLAVVVVLLILQIPIFNPKKNYTDADTDVDITDKYDVPMDIQMDLYGACYNCHSNYTENYPWYYNIQPVSWWMNHHIMEGKEELNFSEFATYPPDTAAVKFKKLHLVMREHTMPLKSYLWLHDEAKLTDKQYRHIAEWAKKNQNRIEAEIDAAKTH
ncbi:heme-binding domain-containing protein [Flavobacteriaceae bacterium F89]|uniref:Heme-binding domain-containing protein n=1 Tax=Cerina litoralis TaxID=2874477 RepID=A0AAE3EW80_9FLAO|nr:heme-binding domain-containing protein [Cerina litoralis]MCG2462245.1 heme-binding domain-containing protein [Cerina litoralis]